MGVMNKNDMRVDNLNLIDKNKKKTKTEKLLRIHAQFALDIERATDKKDRALLKLRQEHRNKSEEH